MARDGSDRSRWRQMMARRENEITTRGGEGKRWMGVELKDKTE